MGSSATERLRIDSAGTATFSGDAGSDGSQWTATTNAISGTGLTVLAAGSTAGAGGGGGGSYNSAAATNYNGGTGGNGVTVLTYTPVPPANGSMFMMF